MQIGGEPPAPAHNIYQPHAGQPVGAFRVRMQTANPQKGVRMDGAWALPAALLPGPGAAALSCAAPCLPGLGVQTLSRVRTPTVAHLHLSVVHYPCSWGLFVFLES